MPATKVGFQWTGSAVKGLAGLGAVYVRLTKNLAGESTESNSGDARSTRERVDDSDSSDFEESPQFAGSESRQHHQLERRSQCAVPDTGTLHAPVDVDSIVTVNLHL